jgi:PIN domain nuclease of toxin-antitoxin system
MKLLLDTHAFLSWVGGAPPVGRRAKAALANPDNEVFLSLASCWEIAIKISLGKLRLAGKLDVFLREQLRRNAFSLLELELRHIVRVAELPFHHRDPFDRLLAAQALEDQLVLVSGDRVFRTYGVTVTW